ncbi:MAG: hypothetical protein LQ347_005616 [Umbilicaria vellea]|nr:MAG: hypothetical protein LQ347_005616 [Umbilicaria vellea]
MRALSLFTLAVTALLIGHTLAVPIVVTPGGAKDLIITSQDTVNGTYTAGSNSTKTNLKYAANGNLPLSFINNLSDGIVNAYVTGLDVNNHLVMLQPDGTWYYPSAAYATAPQPITANVAIPLGGQGSTTSITLPGYISAGRIWFAEGHLQFFVVQGGNGPSLVEPSAVNPSDPSAGINWGFVELTNIAQGGLFANISYVDFVGLVLGMILQVRDGSTQSAKGLQADAVSRICSDLIAQSYSDGQPWNQLCMTDNSGNRLRVLAPIDYISLYPNAYGSYWTDYVNRVWSMYSSQPLVINTQAAAGAVNCRVTGDNLYCDGDNRGYSKPTANDIFGCNSGPFAIQGSDNDVHRAVVPRLCAAFNRATLLVGGGNVQPSLDSSHSYTASPSNYFSKVVHNYEVDGKGYAFSYDDVTADGEINESGVVASANPQLLTIVVGGPTS